MKILPLSSQNRIKSHISARLKNHNSNINIEQKPKKIHGNSQNPSIITTRYHLSDALAILERTKQVTPKNKS